MRRSQQPSSRPAGWAVGRFLIISALAGAAVGALVSWAGVGAFAPGWLAASALLVPGFAALAYAHHRAGGGRMLALMIALAFALRLGFGIGLSKALPAWGYQDPVTNKSSLAGYLFQDAYERDTRAWDLAQSNQSIWTAFSDDLKTDQYGGLLALSALVYRLLSPDAHRPALVILLGALAAALGVPFFYRAAASRWSARAAAIAAWIYVLYPDAIFFSASQMREPFLVGLSAAAFWAVLALRRNRILPWAVLAFSLLGMALFSTRVTIFIAGGLVVLFLLDRVVPHADRRVQVAGWASLGLGAVLVVLVSWAWFRSSAGWDVLVTLNYSGQLVNIIKQLGDAWAWPVITLYGLAQPVLPAAISDTGALPLWRTIATVRALGWYALAPFLVYGVFRMWKIFDPRQRRLIIGAAVTMAVWFAIASLRGGGDQTDNPRYRSLFIVWAALLAGWAVDWALSRRDAWLGCWLLVEGIFLGFFTSWYFSRYFHLGGRMPVLTMAVWILALSAVVIALTWVYERRKSGGLPKPLAFLDKIRGPRQP